MQMQLFSYFSQHNYLLSYQLTPSLHCLKITHVEDHLKKKKSAICGSEVTAYAMS